MQLLNTRPRRPHEPLINLDGVNTPPSHPSESEGDDYPVGLVPDSGEDRVIETSVGRVRFRHYGVVVKCEHCRKKANAETFPFAKCHFCFAEPSYNNGRCCSHRPEVEPEDRRTPLAIGTVMARHTTALPKPLPPTPDMSDAERAWLAQRLVDWTHGKSRRAVP